MLFRSFDFVAEGVPTKAAAAVALARTPLLLKFDKEKIYEWQEELDVERAEQWAILHLEAPVACSLPCAGIGSHLDVEKENTCRLAFHGMMVHSLTQEETETLKIFKKRSKEGQVDRVQDESTVICKNLFQPGTDMNLFLNMKVQLGEAFDGEVFLKNCAERQVSSENDALSLQIGRASCRERV